MMMEMDVHSRPNIAANFRHFAAGEGWFALGFKA